MKKLSFVFGSSLLALMFLPVESVHAAIRWADFFENTQASLIQYGSARDTEIKRNIRPRLTPRANTDTTLSTTQLFGPEKNKKIGLGMKRPTPLPKMERFKLVPDRPLRLMGNLEEGASSYKKYLSDGRKRDKTTPREKTEEYLRQKTNAFDPTRYNSIIPAQE